MTQKHKDWIPTNVYTWTLYLVCSVECMLQFIWKNYLSLVKTPSGSWFSKSPGPRAKSESPHSVTNSVMSGKSPQLTTSIPAPWLLRPLLALRAEFSGFTQDRPEPQEPRVKLSLLISSQGLFSMFCAAPTNRSHVFITLRLTGQ